MKKNTTVISKPQLPFSPREFDPTDEELIEHYLRSRILGLRHQPAPIADAVVFGEKISPWEKFCNPVEPYPWLVDLTSTSTSAPTLFLFTNLTNVGTTDKSSRIQKVRSAGCGTWHGTSCPKPVFSSAGTKIKIGTFRILSFRSLNGEETVGQWTMYEYTISPEAFPEIVQVEGWQDLVICKIKRNDNKCNAGGRVSRKNIETKKLSNKKKEVVISSAPPVALEEKEAAEIKPAVVPEDLPVDENYYGEYGEMDDSNLDGSNMTFDIDELLTTLGC